MQLKNRKNDASLKNPAHPGMPFFQPKLSINQPNDVYEQEADAVADKVMRMPDPSINSNSFFKPAITSIQRKCAHCEEEEKKMQRKEMNGDMSAPAATESYITSLSGGKQLDEKTRNFFEPRMGYDFSNVKIHTDTAAAKSAQSVNALAYTTGKNIVFNRDQFNPETDSGKRLLGHELTHVVQQNSNTAIRTKPVIQREIDDRTNDPNFLLCLALCELGMPPGIWRDIMDEVMQAVSVEYGNSLDRRWFAHRSPTFRQWSAEFATWGTFNKLKLVLVFIAEGKIGLIPIRTAGAAAIRARLMERIVALGIRETAVVAASQIIRKVAIFLEVAYALGCATYCGAVQAANAIIEFSEGVAQTLSYLQSIGEGIGSAITRGISRIFFTTQATLDPTNWRYTDLPARSRRHLNVISLITRLSSSGDEFLRYVARPLQSVGVDASILNELSQDINTALHSRGGFFQAVAFTPDFIGRGSLLSLIQILHDYNIIQYIRDPAVIAEEMLLQQPTETEE
ncbi:MAG: eCIS core domain-containing protein [Parafilimonas sp.]